MTKVSKAQQAVMDRAKAKIDKARAYEGFETYYEADRFRHYKTAQELQQCNLEDYNRRKRRWEEEKDGIVYTHCSSKTIEKLQDLGLIEIIKDSKGESFGIDIIKVLNY